MNTNQQPFPANFYHNLPCNNLSLLDPRLTNVSYQNEFQSDQQWIDYWLTNRPTTTECLDEKTSKNDMKICELKNSLKESLHILTNMKSLENELKDNVETMSSSDWKEKTVEIGQQKDKLVLLMVLLENSEVIRNIKKKIQKRKFKRKYKKYNKLQRRQEIEISKEKREQKNRNIDKWLQDMKEEVEKTKKEERFKKDADCILSEVNKKKSDGRKCLALITSLVKLRTLREKTALARGEKVSKEDSNAFQNITDQLQQMWYKVMEKYTKEEQELKSKLKNDRKEPLVSNVKCSEEWEEVLFGPKFTPNNIYWGLTIADRDLETFIALRKSWDTFLTSPSDTNGSKIPIGWVMPQSDTLDEWKQYLNN